jgi:branched-chain amino acid transport system permease protein
MNLDLGLIAIASLQGVLTGGIYALMASGLTLIFGVMDIINIAQGALVILGAYLSYVLSQYLHIDLFVGLLITMPVMFGLGLLIEWAFIRPIKRDRTRLSILVTYGLAILIEGTLGKIFSTDTISLHAWYVTASVKIGDFYLTYIYVLAFLLAVVLLFGLYILLYRTKFGASVRATVQDRTAAQLIGIDVEWVSALTFGIGAALTAAGGMAFGATSPAFNPGSHYDLISRLLVIIVLGGLGSLGGALVASVLLLVIEDVTDVVWSPTWATTVFFIVLVIVLLVRPQGLFGQIAGRKQ